MQPAEEGNGGRSPSNAFFEDFRCDGGRRFAVASWLLRRRGRDSTREKLDFACGISFRRATALRRIGKIGTEPRRTEDYFLVYPAEIIFTEDKDGRRAHEFSARSVELFLLISLSRDGETRAASARKAASGIFDMPAYERYGFFLLLMKAVQCLQKQTPPDQVDAILIIYRMRDLCIIVGELFA